MVPFWGRCTTCFRLYFSGDWDVDWNYGLDFDRWPYGTRERRQLRRQLAQKRMHGANACSAGAHAVSVASLPTGEIVTGSQERIVKLCHGCESNRVGEDKSLRVFRGNTCVHKVDEVDLQSFGAELID